MDMEVLDEAARITCGLIYGWAALRLLDIAFREQFGTAFHFDRFAGVFWLEMITDCRRRIPVTAIRAHP